MRPIENFINEDDKQKTKIFLFRMEQGMMKYLDHYKDLTGKPRSQLVREAIEDKTRSNRLIKKLLLKETLDELDYSFIHKIIQEPY